MGSHNLFSRLNCMYCVHRKKKAEKKMFGVFAWKRKWQQNMQKAAKAKEAKRASALYWPDQMFCIELTKCNTNKIAHHIGAEWYEEGAPPPHFNTAFEMAHSCHRFWAFRFLRRCSCAPQLYEYYVCSTHRAATAAATPIHYRRRKNTLTMQCLLNTENSRLIINHY